MTRNIQTDFAQKLNKVLENPELAKKIIGGARTWAFVGIGAAMNQLNIRPKTSNNAD